MPEVHAGRTGRFPPIDRPGDAAPEDETLVELRSIIVGPELHELQTFRARFVDPAARTRDVSSVLADAIAQRASDPQLARALAPPVEEAITASVRRDPQPLADALFPAIGPAIRKAIAHTLSSMMDSLNRTVEHSLSWRALQWRWTAFRTGKPFAEIVLLNTLQYRVEQVFLIHRETGLLLQHLAHDPRAGADADQISAMLTAIGDFVRDSFSVSASEGVEAMRVGDLAVLVEQGPYALLACVVRGTPPAELTALMQDALERTHRRLGGELQSFQGESGVFERARPLLESCLVSQSRTPQKARSYRGWLIAAAAVLVLGGVWLVLSMRERQRWNDYLGRLDAEPGLTVVSSGRRGGRFFVAGLRDPLAADPSAFLAPAGLDPGSVESRWEPFQALEPAFVAARATALLRPPSTVTLSYRDGVLRAGGTAPERWIVDAERLAPAIAGVRLFEFAGPRAGAELQARIEAMTVLFPKGQPAPTPGQDAALGELATLLAELNEVLVVRGLRGQVEFIGHTDMDGTHASNEALSLARAEFVVSSLPAPRLEAIDIRAVGVGSTQPLAQGADDQVKQRNRRVSFRVHLPDAPGPSGRLP